MYGIFQKKPNLMSVLKKNDEIKSAIVYEQSSFEVKPKFADFRLPETVLALLKANGIQKLFSHQIEALRLLEQGHNIIVSTPTSSGKTLIYTIQLLKEYLNFKDSSFFYITPLKALAQDQIRQLKAFFDPVGFGLAIYDGDTPSAQRKKIRERHPNLLLTNPDMLHRAFLPFHHSWKEFFKNLRYVVLDEVHSYRGIFGSHVHQILKRLKRIVSHYGRKPKFILLSASIGNPKGFGERLLDEPVVEITNSGAPKASQYVVFLNPKESTGLFAAKVFCHLVRHKIRTIAFTQSRVITELMYLWSRSMLGSLGDRIRPYRAGFLPHQRREIENALATGELLGVISTSALELGIDIGYLEACLLVGYPGTMMSALQRGGRVGRGGKDSLVILIAKEDALDQYFMKNPQEFFQRKVEDAVLDTENPYILEAHLPCAAHELPISQRDVFCWPTNLWETLDRLVARQEMTKDEGLGLFFSVRKNPHRYVDIRSTGEAYSIFDSESGEAIGTIDGIRVFKECHPGAIYLHLGNRYIVTELDLKKRNVIVSKGNFNYFTRIRDEKDTKILKVRETKGFNTFDAGLGDLKVTEFIRGYEKRSFPGQVLLGVNDLDLPPIIFETVGMWIRLNPKIKNEIESRHLHFMGGIHAMEHAMIGMFPLFALCDRNDIGGISFQFHPGLETPGIFLYDGYPGGIGLAEKGYGIIQDLLRKTFEHVSTCPCEMGCPSCIQSPKCGSGNRPLDKRAAILILQYLLEQIPLDSKETLPELVIKVRERPKRILFLDLETQFSSLEVGGWENAHLMRVSVACVYDLMKDEFLVFQEDNIKELIDTLSQAELVVGYNLKAFDYRVLSAYSHISFDMLPTLDLLEEIRNTLGRRIGLNSVAKATLKREKTGDGLYAITLFKEGRLQELIEYCKMDVLLTKELYLYGLQNGYIKAFDNKTGGEISIKVEW